MKTRSLLIIACGLVFGGAWAHADTTMSHVSSEVDAVPENHLEQREQLHRIKIDFFGELGEFQRAGQSFQGAGLGAGVRYGLSEKVAVGFSAAQTYSPTGGLSALYTSLLVNLNYALRGSFVRHDQTTLVDGEKLVDVLDSATTVWGVAVGTEQIFFNGTDTVIPGSGLTAGVFADLKLFDISWTANLSPAILLINGKMVPSVVGRLGFTFPF